MVIDFNIVDNRDCRYLHKLLDMFFNRNRDAHALLIRHENGFFELKRVVLQEDV